MPHSMVNIKRPNLAHGWIQICLEHRSYLYINCTTLKLVVNNTNVV